MRVLSTIAAALCAASLVACGGGGGSAGGGNVISPPASTPNPPNLTQIATQRTDAESGLVGVEAYTSFESGGSATTLTKLRHSLSRVDARVFVTHARRMVTCDDGVEESSVQSGSSVILTIDTYYDAACTTIETQLVWTATQNGDDMTGPATFTDYSTTGAVTSTANAVVTFVFTSSSLTTLSGISILLTDATGQAGIACSETASETVTTCGVAATGDSSSLNEELGADATVAVSSGTQISMQISTYEGALNGLTVAQGTFPAWTISPASSLASAVSITGGPTASGFTLTMSDATDGGTLSITGNASGTVTGTLTNTSTGATVATFTVDGQGNGTITYSTGATGTISDYVIES